MLSFLFLAVFHWRNRQVSELWCFGLLFFCQCHLILITVFQIVPADTITEVKGFESQTFQETGEIIGMASVNVYSSCQKPGCFNKKLVNDKCSKCNTIYTQEECNSSAVCNVLVNKSDSDETVELTLFDTQIKELLRGTGKQIDGNAEEFTAEILKIIPAKVTYTPSPKKDKTLSSFRKVD